MRDERLEMWTVYRHVINTRDVSLEDGKMEWRRKLMTQTSPPLSLNILLVLERNIKKFKLAIFWLR